MSFNFESEAVEEAERWFPAVPLKNGKYSDVGMRFRLNVFDAKDSYVPLFPNTKTRFYDMTLYNSDTFDSPNRHKILA